MMTLKHRNVATFFGLFQETADSDGTWYFLQEYGVRIFFSKISFLPKIIQVRGSLQDILGKVQVTWQVKKSFLHDIASGMSYIHKSSLKYHQMLTSSSCLVTGRMEVKVANFGVERIRMKSKIAKNRLYSPDNESELQYYTLWSAPELLRNDFRTLTHSSMVHTVWLTLYLSL